MLVNARGQGARLAVTGFDVAGARDLLTGRVMHGDTLALPGYGAVVLERGPR